jgi:photosystem II stability/assembly factor-like uncharacterized protein
VYHGVAIAPNGLDAWVVNIDSVAIYHSPDFGTTWEPQTISTTRQLFGVFFIDEERGWTCGEIGAIHATTDGGLNWYRQNLGGPKFASRIQFLDTLHGFSSGGTAMLMFTTDGGQQWSSDFFPSPPFPSDTVDFQGLSFVDPSTGWLVAGRYPEGDTFYGGQGYIAKVIAGGDTFQHILQLKDTVYDFFDVDFADSMNGWVVGGEDIHDAGAVFHTTNGGTDWVQQTIPVGAHYLRAVDFVSPSQGWACGRNGTIVHTSDRGQTWESQFCIADTTLFDIQFVDSLRGMIAGNTIVLYTTDGGAQWVRGFGGVEESPRTAAPSTVGLVLSRNPVKRGVRFRASGLTHAYGISVYDAAGRRVRALRRHARGRSEQVEWDGCDASGQPVQSGLYVARLESGGRVATARFVFLKE